MGYTAEGPAITPDNPFPGLFPFTEADRLYFFGRQGETAELARMVRRNVTTLLFGRSGLGKTSLLHAGVFPALREDGFLPVPVRLLYAHDAPGLGLQIHAALATAAAAAGAELELLVPLESLGKITLWEMMHRVRLWNQRNNLLTPVLAFDQFEEIFTLGANSGCAVTYVDELANLIENRVPAPVRAAILETGELPDFDYESPSCRFLLALREDFLPALESIANHVPSLRNNRMRLDRLDGARAMEAVRGPAESIVSQDVALALVRFVAAAQEEQADVDVEAQLERLAVEPALLSVVCRELNKTRMERGLPVITRELLAERKGAILADLYEQTVAPLGERVRVFIEDRLLTRAGYRTSVSLDDAIAEGSIKEPEIASLVASRLLSVEDRLGVRHIELSHDLLTSLVRQSRDQRHQAEAEQERLHRERADAERLRRRLELEQEARISLRRRTIQFAFAGVVLATLLVCASFYAGIAAYFSLYRLSAFENIEGDSLRLYQLQSEYAAIEYVSSVEHCPLELAAAPDWVLRARKRALFYCADLLNDYPEQLLRAASNAAGYVEYFVAKKEDLEDQLVLKVDYALVETGRARNFAALSMLSGLDAYTANDENRDILHLAWLLRALLENQVGDAGASEASMAKAEEIGCSEGRSVSTHLAKLLLCLHKDPAKAQELATSLGALLEKYPDAKIQVQLNYYYVLLAENPQQAIELIVLIIEKLLPRLPNRVAGYWKTVLLARKASLELNRGDTPAALAAWNDAGQACKAFLEADPLELTKTAHFSLMHAQAALAMATALPWQMELPPLGEGEEVPVPLQAVLQGRAAYAALLAGQPEDALQKAQAAALLDTFQPWLQLALAHATLFEDGPDEAIPLYLACRFHDGGDTFTLLDRMEQDFAKFEAAGLNMEAMNAVRQAISDPANRRDHP